MRIKLLAAALLVSAPVEALSQASGLLDSLSDPSSITDAAVTAVDTMRSQASEHLLASNILGQEVTGPGGDTVGTIEDLVVVPGGKLVAVLIKPRDGEPIALPYQALKASAVASAGDSLGFSLPVSLEEARGMQSLQDLTSAIIGSGN